MEETAASELSRMAKAVNENGRFQKQKRGYGQIGLEPATTWSVVAGLVWLLSAEKAGPSRAAVRPT